MISRGSKWEVGVLSKAGPVREENQDRMCGRQASIVEIFVVADGMGGHRGGGGKGCRIRDRDAGGRQGRARGEGEGEVTSGAT